MTDPENSTAEPIEAESASPDVPAKNPETGLVAEPGAGPAADSGSADAPPREGVDADVEAPGVKAPNADAATAEAEGGTPDAEATASPEEPVERPAPVTDEVLLSSVDVARAALLEVTPESTIGDVVGHAAEDDHVLSLFFDSKLPGYPGWHWTVTLARVGDDGPATILETELMPGEKALLAPDWVPWSERLADYQASQELAEIEARALAEAAADLDDIDDDEDEDEFSILHAGDVDGVDVDEIDEPDEDDDESDEGESDEDESDDDDEDESDDDDEDESDDDDDDDEDESDDDDDDDEDDEDEDESDDDDDDEDESDDDDEDGSDDDDGPERSY